MFDGKYFDWNQKRIKNIIDFYGHGFFLNKKILDLGCGYADISGVLYRLGGVVTAVDARQEHLKIVSKKFPGIQTVKADLDRGWPFHGKYSDIILDLGLLSCLSDYEAHLKTICASTEFLVLETAVCDSDDPYRQDIVQDSKISYDGSFNGISSRVSSAAIERVLKACGMNFKRMDQGKFNSGPYVYDWSSKNDNSFDINKRRIWFAVKSTSDNQVLILPQENKPLELPSNIKQSGGGVLQDSGLIAIAPKAIPKTDFITTTNSLGLLTISKKSIKTAVCISGHLRTFESNFKSVYDNLLSKLDCDVFIHTWDILGLSYRHTDSNLFNMKTIQIASLVENMYRPKKMIIEPSKTFEATSLMRRKQVDRRDVSGILAMFYKIEACNQLKLDYEAEHNFKYDCVIRFRGDLFLEQIMPVDGSTNLNYLQIPVYGNFGGINDQIAWGNSSVMDSYCSLYSNIEKDLAAGAIMNPEKLLRFHIDSENIQVAKVNFKYLIKRANGLIQDNMLLERALGFIR